VTDPDDRLNTNRRRRRRRLLLLAATLPLVIALLLLAMRLMGLSLGNQVALSLFDDARFEESAEQSTTLLDETFFEPYIPWFNRGNAYAAQEKYTDAIDDLEHALELAPASRQCEVRVNLALSWERLGDVYVAGGYYQGAVLLYEAAKAVIQEGDECVPPEQSGEDLDAADARLDAKIEAAKRLRDIAGSQGGANPETNREQQLDELGQQEQQGAEEKAEDDAFERGDGGQSGYTEKPW
jgi:tetratricopeptide (TPR) repeat protein